MIPFLCLATLFLTTFPPAPHEQGTTKQASNRVANSAAESGEGAAKTSKKGTTGAIQSGQKINQATGDQFQESQVVKVTIATSRAEVTSNGGYGVYADLENLASVPVTIYPDQLDLVSLPELTLKAGCSYASYAFFPTEPDKDKDHPSGWPILIQPNEHYQVFWDVNTQSCSSKQTVSSKEGWFTSWYNYFVDSLSFVPGDYTFVVEGKAHLAPDTAADSNYHTFEQSLRLHVGITQINSMLAAMLGGVIAYFVIVLRQGGEFGPLKPGKNRSKYWIPVLRLLVFFRNLFSAALLSGVVTIILSRISDTQFPIKVSVSDFWGALTIGFVAYFTGNKIIDKLVGMTSPSGGGNKTQETVGLQTETPGGSGK